MYVSGLFHFVTFCVSMGYRIYYSLRSLLFIGNNNWNWNWCMQGCRHGKPVPSQFDSIVLLHGCMDCRRLMLVMPFGQVLKTGLDRDTASVIVATAVFVVDL
jgi:hypothetical protein